MNPLTRTSDGRLRLSFSDDVEFNAVKKFLTGVLGAQEKEELRSVSQVWLDLEVGGSKLTLHWDDMAGLYLFSEDAGGEQAVEAVARHFRPE